jgi:two-component system, LytTR family, response regulator
MSELKVLVAEDEAPARDKMVRLLQEQEDVEVVNVSTNGLEALENIVKFKPDVAFLDIEMPAMNGLDVVRNLPPDIRPHIVFATAYNEHAINAFEMNAIDYLLKPFNGERLAETFDRIRRQPNGQTSEDVTRTLDSLASSLQAPALNKIPVPTADRYRLLEYDEVLCIEVDERVTNLYTAEKSYVMNMTLEHFERKLPGDRFLRVSRSAIVNLNAVKEIVLWFGNRYKIVLSNKKEVISSRERSKYLKQLLKF